MSEIRFSIDNLLEEKIEILQKRLKMNSKKKVFEYLINKQFEKDEVNLTPGQIDEFKKMDSMALKVFQKLIHDQWDQIMDSIIVDGIVENRLEEIHIVLQAKLISLESIMKNKDFQTELLNDTRVKGRVKNETSQSNS